jgi:hypothetical protein
VSGSINIPPYATLYGEGSDNSVITMDAGVDDYVARTADSFQQTGVNIGSDPGSITPQYVTISNMGFSHAATTGSIFLVQDATNCTFTNVGFRGASTQPDLDTMANNSIGVSFASTNALVCEQINFEGCVFSGLVWGINTSQQTKSITISNSQFDTLYRGIELGVEAPTVDYSPTGTRITNNMFDNVFAEGIIFGEYAELNASGQNIFYDVGNYFTGSTGSPTPYTSIIKLQNSNNVSISDLFERSDSFAAVYPRIYIDLNTNYTSSTNGSQIVLATGTYTRQSGSQTELVNSDSGTVFTIGTDQARSFSVNYTINRSYILPGDIAVDSYRTGTIMIATNNGASGITWSDDYAQNTDTGITLSVTQVDTTVTVGYTANGYGNNGVINYSINYLA